MEYMVKQNENYEELKMKEWLEKCAIIHNNFYNYSKAKYSGYHGKITIICPEHGEFEQILGNHIRGSGCPKCKIKKLVHLNTKGVETFFEKAKEIHGEKYDYSKIKYVNRNTKVCIICPEHGEFWQTPKEHINGQGCPKCHNLYSDEKERQEHFLEHVRAIHPDLDFSKTKYVRTHDLVTVTCHKLDVFGEEHGDFKITPHNLLLGHGCKKCSNNYLDTSYFVKKSKLIHGDTTYDYSKTVYGKNNREKVCIICPEHGEFYQAPISHLNGRGCPFCKNSHLEREIGSLFKKMNILYIYQYRNRDIFGKQSIDFYIPSIKLAIECQGEQHFLANFFKTNGVDYPEKHLKYIQELDERKRIKCKENGIELVYFLNKQFLKYLDCENKCFTDKKNLFDYINSIRKQKEDNFVE